MNQLDQGTSTFIADDNRKTSKRIDCDRRVRSKRSRISLICHSEKIEYLREVRLPLEYSV